MSTQTVARDLIRLTESAAGHAREMLAKESPEGGKFLRVYVEGGGCSGLQYGMLFDERRENDLESTCHGVTVLVDPFSADYLEGTVVDFLDDLNQSGFRIANPKARQTCGCGKSFEA